MDGSKKLEKKNNWCSRQCKHQFNGEDLPRTVDVKCKCVGENCHYEFKMKGVFKKWKTWGSTDDEGNYYVDQNGVPSKQELCGAVPGVWSEWGDFSCQGTCPQNSFIKRTRECSNDHCIGPSEEIKQKCLRADFDQRMIEPLSRCDSPKVQDCLREHQCSVRHGPGWLNKDYNEVLYFNEGSHCHFPSFGKGWFDQTMENGDHVQMGVECDGGWNNEDHSIAVVGETCHLVCKNLSGNDNIYSPVTNEFTSFQCKSPIPVFAYQHKKCNRDFSTNSKTYDDCYDDWVEKGLDMGSSIDHESHRTA